MVRRRTVLVAAAAGAAVGAVGVAAAAPAMVFDEGDGPRPGVAGGPAAAIPRTVSHRRAVVDGRLRVTRTDFRLSHLGLTFAGASAQVRVRTAAGWGPWHTVSACGGAPDRGDGRSSVVLAAPGADGYDVATTSAASVLELNTVDGPVIATAATPQAGMRLAGLTVDVPYLNRAAWGANESLRFRDGAEYWPPTFVPVQTLTVHHTATAVGSDPAATVRAIYQQQAITKDWGDIGYHLLIDSAGRVYEGRFSGGDGSPVHGPTPGIDGRPLMTVGGHVKNFNAGNIGVCLLGDFTSGQPSPAAVSSLTKVLAALVALGQLSPLGTVDYVDADSGQRQTRSTISGHRNWAETACPGNAFYPNLAAIRTAVAASVPPWQPPQPPTDPQPPDRRLPGAPTPVPDQRTPGAPDLPPDRTR